MPENTIDDQEVLSLIDAVQALDGDEEPSSAAGDGSAAHGPRVVLAEDDDDYRGILRYLLTSIGCDVAEAPDGRQALELALAKSPDLILADFGMPLLNGYELFTELRSRADTRRVPVIILTGVSNRGQLRETMDDLSMCLEKPVSNARILEEVGKFLGGRVRLKEAVDPGPQQVIGSVESALESVLESEEPARTEDEPALEAIANDSPIVAQVNRILAQAVQIGASDIHVEPFEKEILVRFRVNGSLMKACALPPSYSGRLAARIKVMSNLLLTERRRPQDGRIRARIFGKKVEFRVSTLPSVYGEKIVLRVPGGAQVKDRLDLLELSPRDLECVSQALASPNGLVLVTGPTGSGKSTTLYTMIRAVSSPEVNVVTAEDPIEAEIPGVTQTAVRPDLGVTFETSLRAFLRQDPDIMLVGEIRDLETAQIAVKASITGHLVLSTLHTNSAPSTALRLIHMGIPGYLAASSVRLIVAQRLVKRLCPRCREEGDVPDVERKSLTEAEKPLLPRAWTARGCEACHRTGCTGRRAIFEVMPVRSAAMRRLLVEGCDLDAIVALAEAEGMSSLRNSALALAAQGEVSLAEALRVGLGES